MHHAAKAVRCGQHESEFHISSLVRFESGLWKSNIRSTQSDLLLPGTVFSMYKPCASPALFRCFANVLFDAGNLSHFLTVLFLWNSWVSSRAFLTFPSSLPRSWRGILYPDGTLPVERKLTVHSLSTLKVPVTAAS